MSTPASGSPAPVRTFRQGGALAAGAVVLAMCLLWIAAVVSADGPVAWRGVLWPLAASLLFGAAVVRPSVQVRTDGVVLRNVLRDVHLPWPQIDLVEVRWALVLVTPQGRAYTSWAITRQRPGRDRATGQVRVGLSGLLGGLPSEVTVRERAASSAGVGALIRDGVQQWPARVASGDWPAQEGPVRCTPAPMGLALVGSGLLCALVATFA